MDSAAHPDSILPNSILIVDFGSQVTQLIARRVREAGVYCEIAPFSLAEAAFERMKPKGIILSGSPASVCDDRSPRAPQVLFDSGLPILGICYGQQVMSQQLGGEVRPGHETGEGGEFGRAFLTVTKQCALFDGLWSEGERHQVWMSHGDKVTKFAPGFEIVATSDGAPFAVIADEARRYYGTQFHPEVVHTPDGAKLLANFVHKVCGLAGDWTMAAYRETKVAEIREQVGDGRVICGLSGGVDSSVAAILIHEAIGDQLTCVFVDHGLLRLNEREQVESLFRDHYNIPLVVVDAEARFMAGLEGVTDPEKKRKFIGGEFIAVFEEEAAKIRAQTDKEVTILLAKAYQEEQHLKGAGDGESTRIYATAFEQDPEFFAFLRSLETYESALSSDTELVLSTGAPVLQYLADPNRGQRQGSVSPIRRSARP